jgi:serine protease Do
MTAWITRGWEGCRKRPAVALLALALAVAVGAYTAHVPVRAGVSSNTAPLDSSQVGALLSLDQAMEAVAARVTPAIVNVAVTSHAKTRPVAEGVPDDLQRFFGHELSVVSAAVSSSRPTVIS